VATGVFIPFGFTFAGFAAARELIALRERLR
jgi:hypothetical protein